MKSFILRFTRWFHCPAAVLLTLLQRTPVLQLAASAEQFVLRSASGSVLKATAAALAALGAIDSMAGATVLAPSAASPLQVTQGTAITPVVFGMTNTIDTGSWQIGGNIPPGLSFITHESGGNTLSGPGELEDPGLQATAELVGTPTKAGSYAMTIQAFGYRDEAAFGSNTFTYTVVVASDTTAPSMTTEPQSQAMATGATVAFNVSANGTPTPTYQWTFNGGAISGATSPTLLVGNVGAANAGTYACTASNSTGSVTSSPATLTVVDTATPGHLINIAARSFVGTGGKVLIAGFVVQGSSPLPVLVRSSGPALSSDGVSGVLSDPELQLYSGSNNFATNAGWGGDAQIISTAAAVGASPWTNSSSLDSALLESLNPGAYTGITSGASGDAGVSLAEVYDATPSGTFTSTSPHLINIAARAFVGTGGDVLIAGFVIGGSTSKTVLIRASGPALASDGVSGVLSDPQVQLYSGSSLIATNAGWGGNAQIVSVANSVGASAWTESNSLDSALLVTLPPGGYTAIISGVSGDTGIALAEVYDVE